jgi:branched-chain amino acid transport system ATP-binding protein
VIEVRNVVAGYGEATVLRRVALKVPRGRVVALLGPNGAGKTTLLRVMSGLLAPSSGEVLVDGLDLAGRPPEHFARAGICHVPEGRGIFRSMTVRENLELQATTGRKEDAVELAVAAFPRLGERLTQVAGTMSGGEQQMLALARSYVSEAPYVLLDEVSLGLAPLVVDEIFVFLEQLKSRGVGLLLVEQYVARALELADFVLLMNQGELVFAGEPSEVDANELLAAYTGAA